MVISPAHLVVKVPDNVSDQEAVYTVVSSIALQGVRLVKSEIGEKFAVLGVGLIGLLATQILIVNGCQAGLVVDFDQEKLDLASGFGAVTFNMSNASDLNSSCKSISVDTVDGVLVCASTSKSDPVNTAASIARVRGRVIQIGLTGRA